MRFRSRGAEYSGTVNLRNIVFSGWGINSKPLSFLEEGFGTAIAVPHENEKRYMNKIIDCLSQILSLKYLVCILTFFAQYSQDIILLSLNLLGIVKRFLPNFFA